MAEDLVALTQWRIQLQPVRQLGKQLFRRALKRLGVEIVIGLDGGPAEVGERLDAGDIVVRRLDGRGVRIVPLILRKQVDDALDRLFRFQQRDQYLDIRETDPVGFQRIVVVQQLVEQITAVLLEFVAFQEYIANCLSSAEASS